MSKIGTGFYPALCRSQATYRLAIVVGMLLAAACSPVHTLPSAYPPASTHDLETPSPDALNPSSTAALPAARGADCVPTGTSRQVATVTRVIDGDTIEVRIDDRDYRVRYIGVDAPEVGKEAFASQATRRNRDLVEDQTVTLVKDVSETDKYGRLLRYVFAGDWFVNYELVFQGYAWAATFPPDVACAQTFQTAAAAARDAARGLWRPTSTPIRTP